jgi:hypothetical protein
MRSNNDFIGSIQQQTVEPIRRRSRTKQRRREQQREEEELQHRK